jgi:hypothetical protein
MIEVTQEELEKRAEVERIKDASNYLRGTLVKSLQDPLPSQKLMALYWIPLPPAET